MAVTLSLKIGSYDWSRRCLWNKFKASFRVGIGMAASFELDTTGIVDSAPRCSDRFTLTLPTGETCVLIPNGDPSTFYRTDGSETITVHSYECVDVVTALDRIPLPALQFIESNAGEIITTLIGLLDSTLDVTGVTTGNDVPFLDTADFVKFSDVLKHNSISTGGYIAQFDPSVNVGLSIKADYKDNFGDSGITVDQNSHDFTPQKEPIVPDNNTVNTQRVKSTKPGPHHTVCEFIEMDALDSFFKLKTAPYGLEGTELLNFQFEDGSVSGTDSDGLPNIVPLHYPVQIEVADITLGGTGEICGFVGRSGISVLSVLVTPSSIGANVAGSSFIASAPFATGAHAPDIDHQFYYDFFAFWTAGNLTVQIVENYLNNTAGRTALATVTAIDQSTGLVTLSLSGVSSVDELPTSIRFFTGSDPDTLRGFSTILSRSGSTISIDNWPSGLAISDQLASGDSATTTVTEQVVYSGTAPSNRYGKPQAVISGGSGITARQWTASYGPAIDAVLLPNTYTGAPGRRLRVDTVASRSSDLVVSASGNTAICTLVKDRLPLRGSIQMVINYDAAKLIDVTATDAAGIARCGIRQGDVIESDLVQTAAEATALAQAVLDEFSDPKPKGTITRESILVPIFPTPGQFVSIDLPPEYKITATTVPISDVSIDFGGYDSEVDEGVLIYHIALGSLDSIEQIQRQLLASQTSIGINYRPLSATGARISGATWNDVDTVSLSISGAITLNGISASTSFDPASFAVGSSLRDGPVRIAGTTSAGGVTGELMVQVIYPPEDIDTASVTCSYNPKTNLITYRWGRPAGADISYQIQRLIDDGTGTNTLVFKLIDEILTEQYPLPYEPNSKAIKVRVLALADKVNPLGYQQIECTLATLPAPTPFTLASVPKAVKPNGRIVFLIGPPPAGAFLHRTEFLKILMTTTPVHDPPTVRADFSDSDTNLVTVLIPVQGVTAAKQYHVHYDEWDPGEDIFATAVFVDRFGVEGTVATPFNVTNPPVTAGSISLSDFFQSATQANGGTIVDDDEQSSKTEYTGVFRVHLGQNNHVIKIWMEKSAPFLTGGTVTWQTEPFTSHAYEVSDTDILNGYADIPMVQRFKDSKKKHRQIRPASITFIGPLIREVVDGSGNKQSVQEKRHLVGYNGSAPALVPNVIDAVFVKDLFIFQPGIVALGNTLAAITGVGVTQQHKGLKITWNSPDDGGIRRIVLILSTTTFGTKGPGTDSVMGTDLNTIFAAGTSTGTMLVYNAGNTLRNVSAGVLDLFKAPHHRIHNGDVIGPYTIVVGSTYFVSVLAQNKAGRWSTALATAVSTISGATDTVTPPPATSTPTLGDIVENFVDPAAGGSNALVTFLVWADPTHTKAFNDTTIGATEIGVILRTGDTEDKVVETAPITNLAATSQRIQKMLEVGRTYTWRYATLGNGGGSTKSTPATVSFVAGMPSATLPIASLSISAVNFHHSLATVTITQPSTFRPIKSIKLFQNSTQADKIGVLNDTLFNANSVVGTHTFRIKHAGSVVQTVFARLVMADNVSVDSNTVIFTPGQDPPTDAAAPAIPPAPVVKEYFGDITVKAKIPATGAQVLVKWQLAMTNANTKPSDSDPPTLVVGTILDYTEVAGGVGKWRIPGTTSPRYFWARCMNASNFGIWSFWSPSTSINTASNPIDAFIGTGAPTLATTTDTNAAAGYATVSDVNTNTPIFPATKEPARLWQDDNGDTVIEVIPPTDANAFSITTLQFEVYKANSLALKFISPQSPETPIIVRFNTNYRPAIRYRIRNRYRNPSGLVTEADKGWSSWTNYMKGFNNSTVVATYDPAVIAAPTDDFLGFSSRPINYTL